MLVVLYVQKKNQKRAQSAREVYSFFDYPGLIIYTINLWLQFLALDSPAAESS